MKIIKQLDRFKEMDQFINSKCTGTPQDFAYKIGVSRSHLYRLIETLKDYGAPIKYSRQIRSFYYSKPCSLEKILPVKSLNKNKMEGINGGCNFFFVPSHIFQNNNIILAQINCYSSKTNYHLLAGCNNLKIVTDPIF